jgi:hypothetical protein
MADGSWLMAKYLAKNQHSGEFIAADSATFWMVLVIHQQFSGGADLD